jgi:hypothetical protein
MCKSLQRALRLRVAYSLLCGFQLRSRIGGKRAGIGDAPVFASCGRISVAVEEATAKFTARACVDIVSVTSECL